MLIKKVRIGLQAFNYKLLDEACKSILEALFQTEKKTNIIGPIFLPTRKRLYCVLRSPHVDKDSREQFQLFSYKRIIDVTVESYETLDVFNKLNLPAGVSFKIDQNDETEAVS